MRYRFKGMIRETGRVVEGHVEAPSDTVAYDVLGDNGIVCETLREDPRAGDRNGNDAVSSAIDSALDTAASEVDFDALTNRYKGKKVWVLDRAKIRDRVKQVVLQSIKSSQSGGENQDDTLQKVNEALDKMFADKRNVSTQTGPDGLAVEEQIARLSAVVRKLESSVAQMSNMMRRGSFGGGGGGGGGRLAYDNLPARDNSHDKVLLEIFESNLELQRTIDDPETPTPDTPAAPDEAGPEASPAPAPSAASEPTPDPESPKDEPA